MSPGCRFFRALWLPLLLVVAAAEERAEGCSGSAKKCSNQTISAPFWLRDNKAGRACGLSDFEVTCVNNNTPVLQSSVLSGLGFAIMDIKYEERSLHVVDRGKLKLLSDGCLPMQNTSAKLGVQFRIAPVNRDLILYNCTEKAGAAAVGARRRRELVPTGMGCRNGSKVFIRAGGRYSETGGYGGHAVQGCAAAVLPVLGSSSGEVNASDYERLVRDGFLLTWGLPPAPAPPRKLSSQIIF